MIPGLSMERPSGSGRAGIGIRGCTLPGRASSGASDLELASLAASAGVGTTGGPIGITMTFVSTITITNPTAEFSSIASTSTLHEADLIMVAFAAPAGFMVEER